MGFVEINEKKRKRKYNPKPYSRKVGVDDIMSYTNAKDYSEMSGNKMKTFYMYTSSGLFIPIYKRHTLKGKVFWRRAYFDIRDMVYYLKKKKGWDRERMMEVWDRVKYNPDDFTL